MRWRCLGGEGGETTLGRLGRGAGGVDGGDLLFPSVALLWTSSSRKLNWNVGCLVTS